MATLTRYATTHAAVSGAGWTSPGSVSADDNVYATAAPGKNATLSGDFGGFGFDALLDPTAVVSAVLVEVSWKVSATGVVGELLGAQARVNGVAQGTETTTAGSTAEVAASQHPGALTPADLADAALRVRVRAARGNSNTAYTASLDFVRVTVTYTVPPTAKSGAAVLSGGGDVASTGAKGAAATVAQTAGGSPTATGIKGTRGSGALSGGGTLTSTGAVAGPAVTGATAVSGGGALIATGAKGTRSSIATNGGGALVSLGAKSASVASGMTGGGASTATGVATHPVPALAAAAVVSGGGSPTATGVATRAGVGAESGGGRLLAVGAALRSSATALSGGGALVVIGIATSGAAPKSRCLPPGRVDPVSPGHVIQVHAGHVTS